MCLAGARSSLGCLVRFEQKQRPEPGARFRSKISLESNQATEILLVGRFSLKIKDPAGPSGNRARWPAKSRFGCRFRQTKSQLKSVWMESNETKFATENASEWTGLLMGSVTVTHHPKSKSSEESRAPSAWPGPDATRNER
ncbi:hypothetical protein THAOC_10402 [Thalassiosira oceanica]|uniref:Uncharacterized protein n=1 Tax=Thalassiosira oceanica TaxID=159749 RepID=K0T4W3_THAOC|nr:hypothetical protein THAOC_10402 [Thalassiosira oceanica]|eukprot:EJK68421.1 hypothetical protein THAOC_10402 [Thalassiosira oceanica]